MQIPDDIIENKNVSPFAIRLYCRIKKRCGESNQIRIAVESLGYHRRKIKSLIQQLEAEGYLRVIENGKNFAKTYELLR